MLQVFTCILFFLIQTINCIDCSLTSDYYENLILQKVSEAESYELPQNNVEFKPGLDSMHINDFGSYDFIIVGAGTAGSVLATRLSENPQFKILLLEAGDEETDFSVIPKLFFFLQFSEKNWGYLSTPQKNCCLGMKDKRCMAPRGKSIGGTSAINGVQYVRGNPKDYDKWVELGNPGWSYEEVLPYFMKAENSQIDGDAGYHKTGGFWNVEYALPVSDLFTNLIDGNAELNYSNVDYNGRQQIGVSKNQQNIKHGKRQGAGIFLDYARKRKNLKIVTKAFVTRINIDADKTAAEGVEFVTNSAKFKATATKEVILSAGAVNSPQLLMLSGIGPKKHLEELGIKVVADLPVGENLLDHSLFQGLAFRTNYTAPHEDVKSMVESYLSGYGPLTKSGNIDGFGFFSTKNSSKDIPMLQYMFIPPDGSDIPASIQSRVYNFNEELTSKYLSKLNPKTDIVFFLLLLHQKSKGRITLKSSKPIDFPNIDLNLYSESEDVDNMIEGIEFVLKLTQTEAFRRINATLIDIPVCDDLEKYSKEFWSCVIHQVSMSTYHLTGTTAMGPDKASAVVDYNLKVHGVQKLRVVDAGVFPSTLSGPPYAPTVMVAEKISDVIKSDYQTKKD